MKKKAVFFDLGGTLLVMRRDRIFRLFLAERGRDISVEKVHSAFVDVESHWLSIYGNRALTPKETDEAYRDLNAQAFMMLFPNENVREVEKVSKEARDMWPQLEKTVPLELYPDVEPVLARLREDKIICVLVSNAPADTVRTIEPLGLEKYIEHFVISGVVGYSKPHPEIFRIALKRAGVEPGQTVHVGDLYESDVVGAKNAGIDGILLDRDGTNAMLDCPRIESLDQIYRFVE